MNVNDIVWIDGTQPAIVVGQGHDAQNIADGRVFVVKLGSVEVIEPNEEGGYPFGNSPYDVNAGDDPNARDVNPGGFGENSPAIAADAPLTLVHDGGTPQPHGGYDPAGSDAEPVNAGATNAPTDPATSYTYNGDGTYTRDSDGAIGTFGPDGFHSDTTTTPAQAAATPPATPAS